MRLLPIELDQGTVMDLWFKSGCNVIRVESVEICCRRAANLPLGPPRTMAEPCFQIRERAKINEMCIVTQWVPYQIFSNHTVPQCTMLPTYIFKQYSATAQNLNVQQREKQWKIVACLQIRERWLDHNIRHQIPKTMRAMVGILAMMIILNLMMMSKHMQL